MSDITVEGGLEPFDPYWADEVRRSERVWRVWRRVVALGLCVGAAVIGVAAFAPGPVNAPNSTSAPVATGVGEILDPNLAPLFAFETTAAAQARYEARVDRATGARRDDYGLGALEGGAPALRLEILKSASAPATGSLFVEIAEQSAGFGAVVERLGSSRILAGPHGPVEWAELTLAAGRERRNCVGFRVASRADSRLRGVACAGSGDKIDADGLSCLLDRLALTRAGREAGLADLVKGANAGRPTCRAAIG